MLFIRRNILGLVAIFIALSGVAVAVQKNSVKSRHIVKGGVQSSDVRDDTKKKGGLRSSDIAADALTGSDVDESTLFNDDSLTGGDIDESTLGQVPAATSSSNAESAANAANADAIDGIDSSGLATGQMFLQARNLHSSAIQAGFADVIALPGLGRLQARCSALNPHRFRFRFVNESPVTLDVEIRRESVVHLPDASNPLPPTLPVHQQLASGETGADVELVGSASDDALTLWHVMNQQGTANQTPSRYARFEIVLSGDASNCFAAVLAIASR